MSDNLSVRLHGRAELKSRIEPRDDPTMSIEWFKDDVPIRHGGRLNTYYNRGYAALIITGFEDEDSGRYSCIATNSFGTDRIEASLRLDTRYRARDYERKSREEQLERLQRIKDSMRLADQREQERKAEREARLKKESEEAISRARQRRLADLARRDEQIEQARRRAAEAKNKAEALQRTIREQATQAKSREQEETKKATSLQNATQINDSADGFIGEEDNFRYYLRRPYRELEDSIILKREREIYETVREFEPIKKKQLSDVEEKRAKELERIDDRVRRLRGGDSITSVLTKSEPMIASSSDLKPFSQDRTIFTPTPLPVTKQDWSLEASKQENSEESDGFGEDSFIYTDLKVSESQTLDEEILSDREKLRGSHNQRDSRRQVVFVGEDDAASKDSIKDLYEGELARE